MKALIDTNVLLDVLLAREPWVAQSRAVWDASDAGRFNGFISAISPPNVFYVARKIAGIDKAHVAVAILLEAFDVIPIDRTTLQGAVALPGNDFEDKLQLASALAVQMDFIVTRDPRGFINQECPPPSPSEFLARLAVPPSVP
jgi:predicted nucleic acid-binding protein